MGALLVCSSTIPSCNTQRHHTINGEYMARKLFNRFMPDPEQIRRHRALRIFGHLLHDANLWHFNRYSISTAVFIGLFTAFIPLPTQMLIAASLAIWWRANLSLSIGLVWTSNPVTIPFMFSGAYFVGANLMNQPMPAHFTPSWEWFQQQASALWQPFLLGSVVLGIAAGLIGAIMVRVLWRVQVILRWRARAANRRTTI